MSLTDSIEITLTFHYVGGNSIPLDDIIFGRTELEKGHRHETERIFNEGVAIFAKGEFIRESKFATQDRFVLLRFYELNDNNIEVVADFLARNLPIVQKEQLSLEIDNKEVQFTKEDIKKALKEFLEKKGRQV